MSLRLRLIRNSISASDIPASKRPSTAQSQKLNQIGGRSPESSSVQMDRRNMFAWFH